VLHGCRGCDTGILVHTDAIGQATANWMFSTERAVVLAERLEAAGVPTARLHPHGAGESEPVAQNETPAGRQMNRRVEFVIHP
jgi:outer membrane protein OmpA-like peptidoglycan-associated protein